MKQLSFDEIMASFDPIDRDLVSPPDIRDVDWETCDYLGWIHPDGHRGFMCVPLPERVVGLVYRFTATKTKSGLCSLCLSSLRDCGTTLAMVDSWKKPRIAYGIHVCSDLDCSAAVRGLKKADHMRETISVGQRIERFQMHLSRFARRVTEVSSR